MKVHVISDMEGVAGIVKWQQTTGGDPMYEEGRKLYTEEINAAVRGAKAAGATEIVVMDCTARAEAGRSIRSCPTYSIPAASSWSRRSGRATRPSSSQGATPRC